MRDAAVGFQCPDCVRQGHRDTRQARTTYGGIRRQGGRSGLITYVLIGINAAVWALILATGGSDSPWVFRLSLNPRGLCAAGDHAGSYYPHATSKGLCSTIADGHFYGFASGDWWEPVTSMFTHVEIWHIGLNMLMLWLFGPQLEMLLGRLRFLGLYLLSGLVGAVGVLFLSSPDSSSLGASGAVFGVAAALLVIGHKQGTDIGPLVAWLGINLVYGFFRANISWQDHLGGFVGGAALAAILIYAPRERRGTWQAAGFAGVAVLVVLAYAVRIAALS
jgi:membrane associated rhomboid family serine protease